MKAQELAHDQRDHQEPESSETTQDQGEPQITEQSEPQRGDQEREAESFEP
jgi:hypothetical protein